ncbi:MAG TPA: SDR family NAD(P)-dependent oxidoreductase [Dehalococcoidia bacterium]|nr:SDR family NAD(P)-dependent oxidoreductase [Dehalococcoidia bacterium]
MGNRLAGKVAIVTGGGRGIGRGEALLLAQEGAAVVVNDLGGAPDGSGASSSPADEMVEEIRKAGGKAVANYDSVATMEGGERIVKTALDSFGRLDILVNNAGILRDRMVFNMSEEEWDLVIAVHLKGHFSTIKPAGVIFRQQRSGRIVNTGSSSGLGNMGQANYAAAKEGIVGLTRTVARDLGRYGVTCNAIRPGAATRLTLSPEMEEAARRAAAAGIRRGGGGMPAMPPEAVAPLVVYLCTDAAQNVNGRDFAVMGRQIGLYTIPSVEKAIFAPGEIWTLDELDEIFPRTIGAGLRNEFGPREPAATPAS